MHKDSVRREVWDLLEERDLARFPRPVHGRIPNFENAHIAASRLAETEEWARSRVVKCNPDSPQTRVREMALRDNKTVYMAVPRLRSKRCFIELKPSALRGLESRATTIKGASRHGRKVLPSEMREVDMVVAGSVAVDRFGGRIGKGGGYTDLEFAIATELGLVDDETRVVTTVHGEQVLDEDVRIPMEGHDVPLDVVVTPDSTIRTDTEHDRPGGIMRSMVSEEMLDSIPILEELMEEDA